MKPVRTVPEAQQELIEAARFYEARRPGLGDRFLEAVDNTVAEIREHPSRWPIIGKADRRRFVGRFPYGVIYRDDPDEIVILTIMHLHRQPGYWRNRS